MAAGQSTTAGQCTQGGVGHISGTCWQILKPNQPKRLRGVQVTKTLLFRISRWREPNPIKIKASERAWGANKKQSLTQTIRGPAREASQSSSCLSQGKTRNIQSHGQSHPGLIHTWLHLVHQPGREQQQFPRFWLHWISRPQGKDGWTKLCLQIGHLRLRPRITENNLSTATWNSDIKDTTDFSTGMDMGSVMRPRWTTINPRDYSIFLAKRNSRFNHPQQN